MAVSPVFRPVLDGLRPPPSALRLALLRLLVVVLTSLPALISALSGLDAGAARRPHYTETAGRLPIARLVQLLRDLPDGYVAALGASVVLAVLADQLLTGAAMSLLGPRPPREPRVLAAVWRQGLTHLWPFLRSAALGVVLMGIGATVIGLLFRRLDVIGYREGWTGETRVLVLPLLSAALTALWLASVGALVFWCRLLTAADGRRRVRRTALLALRVLWRHPFRSWGLFVSSTLVTTLLPAVVLAAWRQAEPVRGAALSLLLSGWLAALCLQALVWVWLVRAGWLLYLHKGLLDLRHAPDDAWGVTAWLRSLVRKIVPSGSAR
ncbi:hypothetical protein [Chondromyces crocatus]|uniref:Uncharacterized protein n=1 Tax=Chondromyces crocatus TaxID=52 RepID=A0A0K1E6N9_CHOCO|nr:hypothetical protein [Chondromyces crocatus]AKT36352.1 uncharacterized protein CMC5_004650 [Chondromyces crocatus]